MSAERLKAQQPPPIHEEASRIMRSLKKSPSLKGLDHLGGDGVLRSFSSRGEVVDYKQLSQEEIQLVIKSVEVGLDSDSFKKIVEKMRGVDGRNIIEVEQLLHPGPEGRPMRFNK